ncbi:DUF4352 domain-containing protein [Lachnospiraceae bacterium]|nr:DUF4352 domain-containing protein [Lachnospiraceae bacterium]
MKRKLLTVLLMCTLTLYCSACGNNNSIDDTKPLSSENEKTTENNEKSEDAQENTQSDDNANTADGTSADKTPADDNQETPTDETPADDNQETPADETPADDNQETPADETPETIYNLGAGAPLKDWTISVTDAQIVDSIDGDYGYYSPDDGNKYMHVFVAVNNDGKQADRFLPSYQMGDDVYAEILYSDGYVFSATNLMGYSNDLHDSTINPLSSAKGEIAFEIPDSVADSTEELLIQFSSGNDTIKFKIR